MGRTSHDLPFTALFFARTKIDVCLVFASSSASNREDDCPTGLLHQRHSESLPSDEAPSTLIGVGSAMLIDKNLARCLLVDVVDCTSVDDAPTAKTVCHSPHNFPSLVALSAF